VIFINFALELFALVSVLIVVLLSFLLEFLNGLGSLLLFNSDSAVDFSQLCFFLLHRPESFEDAHNTELVGVGWAEIVREVPHIFEELLVDCVLLDG
jgi:hypothetical protein